MAVLVLFVSYTVIVFLAGTHWRKVAAETATEDRHAIRLSMLSKL